MAKVSREGNQTTLAKRTQDIPDLAVLGLANSAQGKESDPKNTTTLTPSRIRLQP